ncbi:MAG: ABC transporter permease [Clostridiales bacterium]|nr:ABC transporter permease [Clostridiales bacterium]
MSGAIIKTTIREIKASLGRYMAILAIVMLGVALYVGLKMTTPAMIETENDYLRERNFFDFNLLSTVGFTEEDVEKFTELEEIEAAEGTISVDALCVIEDGNESAYKIFTVPETINMITVTAGRLPESANECVLDAGMAGESMIGSHITVTENNNEDTLEMFNNTTYTIVGIVQSPCYINFERGTTAIGDGRIAAFICVPREAFDCDYLTGIYLTTRQKYHVYTDEYDDYIDSLQETVEDKTQELVQIRYDKLVAEAQEKIDDAQTELDDKKAEAQEELDSAWQQITDGEQEIADGELEIADGEQQITDGEQEIADREQEIADGRAEIRQARDMLDEQEAELDEREAQLPAMAAMLPAEQYQAAVMQIQAGREQIAAMRSEIDENERQLLNGEAQLNTARDEIELSREDITSAREDILTAKEDIADAKIEYEDARNKFDKEVADAQQKIDDAQAELDDIEEPDYYALTRNTNIGYACYESDSEIVAGIANVFPVFFFLVAALVCMTTMNRMVEEQRTQIGVLKALGYNNGVIMGKFLFYAGSAALVGAVIGCAVGSWLFPKVIWQGYQIMYNMPEIKYVLNFVVAALSLATAILCSVGAVYFSCKYELYSVPAELIRPKAPKNGKRIFLEKITFIWNRMKFLHKVSARNIIRYKKRFFMMILGISGCTALLVTGFGIKDSVMDIADLQYDEIQIYDIGVSFSEKVEVSDIDAMKANTADVIDSIAYRYEESVDMDYNGKTKSVYMEIFQNPEEVSEFVNLHTLSGEEIAYPTGTGAVLTSKIAKSMGIKAGDTVVLRDNDMNSIEVTVSAVCENFVYNYIYIDKEGYIKQLGTEPEYKSAYANAKDGADIHEAAARIADMDNVLSVSVIQDMRERVGNMMKNMDYIVALIIVCAGSLAFIVLYNLTNINITERIREIATIKVLGFYSKETADYVFRENLILTAIGAVVGLILGKFLHQFVMYQVQIDMISFKTIVKPVSYVLSLLFTFVFAMFVNGIMFFKLEKINMAESLKSIE